MTAKKSALKPIRHTENPFITSQPVLFSTKKWQISRFGKEQGIAINNLEKSRGGTAFINYQKVDDVQFIKLFTQNIKLAFELTQAGQKALYVVFWAIQNSRNNDTLLLDQYTLQEFLAQYPDLKMSLATFWRGLSELVKSQILAMAKRKGFYFINPHFAFNGDRVAFATVLERNRFEKKQVLDVEETNKESRGEE